MSDWEDKKQESGNRLDSVLFGCGSFYIGGCGLLLWLLFALIAWSIEGIGALAVLIILTLAILAYILKPFIS